MILAADRELFFQRNRLVRSDGSTKQHHACCCPITPYHSRSSQGRIPTLPVVWAHPDRSSRRRRGFWSRWRETFPSAQVRQVWAFNQWNVRTRPPILLL